MEKAFINCSHCGYKAEKQFELVGEALTVATIAWTKDLGSAHTHDVGPGHQLVLTKPGD